MPITGILGSERRRRCSVTHSPERIDLYDLDLDALAALLAGWGEPAYRARQIFRQLYVNLAATIDAMTDLPRPLRARLAAATRLGTLDVERIVSTADGLTRKAVLRTPAGHAIETVLMFYPDRATVCVSSQAGCAMGCTFCATGRLGLLRNLSSGAIVEQVVWAAREVRAAAHPVHRHGEGADMRWPLEAPRQPHDRFRPTNVVFMGMGEPFANYDRWYRAAERLHDPRGMGISARSLTVSTVGLVPGIERLAAAALPINLAISLHAPDDTLRGALMPVNQRYPIDRLLAATRRYIEQTGRRVSFEYVLLAGQNDAPEQADRLADLLRGLLCHVNLIPWNPVPGLPLDRSGQQRVAAFQQRLHGAGIACTTRVERGVDIAAACGQLAGTADTAPGGHHGVISLQLPP